MRLQSLTASRGAIGLLRPAGSQAGCTSFPACKGLGHGGGRRRRLKGAAFRTTKRPVRSLSGLAGPSRPSRSRPIARLLGAGLPRGAASRTSGRGVRSRRPPNSFLAY